MKTKKKFIISKVEGRPSMKSIGSLKTRKMVFIYAIRSILEIKKIDV